MAIQATVPVPIAVSTVTKSINAIAKPLNSTTQQYGQLWPKKQGS